MLDLTLVKDVRTGRSTKPPKVPHVSFYLLYTQSHIPTSNANSFILISLYMNLDSLFTKKEKKIIKTRSNLSDICQRSSEMLTLILEKPKPTFSASLYLQAWLRLATTIILCCLIGGKAAGAAGCGEPGRPS